MNRKMIILVTALAAVTLNACAPNDEVDDSPPNRVVATFTGKVDPAFVGKWVSEDGLSTLDLTQDGSASIIAVSMGQGGKSSSNLAGAWAVDGQDLFLKYTSNGQEIVIKSEAKLEGAQLTLVQSGNNHKTVYKKQADKPVSK